MATKIELNRYRGTGFGVRIEDRAPGNLTAGNDIVLLEVARRRDNGDLVILFQDLDFLGSNNETLDIMPFQPILAAHPTATQIKLSITKAADTDVVDGFFALFTSGGTLLLTQALDNVGNDNKLTVTIYDGESYTRGAFQAHTQIVMPEPTILAIFALGLVGLGFMQRRGLVSSMANTPFCHFCHSRA